ncbi:hypothetical protein CWE12_08490 [Aliidiomarina sedimenti]|uniref:Acyltransferase n=1 Tax=Aliidiomarina sedimenti TaxID=1933879 RepID=A0ABY0BZD9_9GAMM|nr:acyltransferase family protein [Aliidiomarina sedimenti]RUO29989.1 hypothetical protein CWE12_08490 [Aliidiomarina sedimenti]
MKVIENVNQYRNDIQGIRAIGALLILTFHIWFNKVSGGVDVFFVVSGFLMTGVLLRAHEKHAAVRPVAFWSHVLKRIAPTAFLVLFTTAIASYFLLPAPLLREFGNELLASAVFTQNLHLMDSSVDYLASALPPSPVQQFWALSVQIQLLFLLPLVLAPLLWFCSKLISPNHRNTVLIVALSILGISSFSYAIYQVNIDPAPAYFNSIARAWQFLVGGLLYLTAPLLSRYLNTVKQTSLAAVGLILLAASAVALPAGASFPGFPALLPVSAALCLLLAGYRGTNAVSRLLGSSLLLAIGAMSFTLYLWHWPILIFYQHFTNSTDVSLVGGIAIIVLALVLSWLTFRFFESPLRLLPIPTKRKSFGLVILCLIPVIAVTALLRIHVLSTHERYIQQLEQAPYALIEKELQLSDLTAQRVDPNELAIAMHYLPSGYSKGCNQHPRNPEVLKCISGDTQSSVVVALVGNSHAAQWEPAITAIAEQYGFQLVTMTKSNCSFGSLEDADESCYQWNDELLEILHQLDPQLVITNSTRSVEGGEFIPQSYVEQWQRLQTMGIAVAGIRDNPRFNFDPPLCLSHHEEASLNCSTPRDEQYPNPDLLSEYEDLIYNVDLTSYLCTDEICPTSSDGKLIYRDDNHLHVPYVLALRAKLADALLPKIQ